MNVEARRFGAGVLAVGLVLAVVYLVVLVVGVWTLPSDDWGVGDQGHDVLAFMAALASSVAVLLGFGAFRLVAFASGHPVAGISTRARPIVVALIASIWVASVIGESVQEAWPHSNGGVDIEVAAPFLTIAFIAFFRALSHRRPARSGERRILLAVGLGLLSAVVVGFGLSWVHGGVDLMVTPFWGYNDNATSVYVIFGGSIAAIGSILVWASATLAGLSNEFWAGRPTGKRVRSTMRQAGGLVFALLTLLCPIMALAISSADPDYSSAGPLVAPYCLGAVCLGVLFAVTSYLLFRPRHRLHDSGAFDTP